MPIVSRRFARLQIIREKALISHQRLVFLQESHYFYVRICDNGWNPTCSGQATAGNLFIKRAHHVGRKVHVGYFSKGRRGIQKEEEELKMRGLLKLTLALSFILAFSVNGQELKLLDGGVLDVGKVPDDTVVSGTIRFRNAGDKPMVIKDVTTSCGCTAANLEKMEYQPGEEGSLSVQFKTRGYSGIVRKWIKVYLEAGTPPVSRIVLQADVTPKLQVDPSFLNLQGLSPNQEPVIKVIHVKNNSDGPIDINEIKTTNDHLVVSVSRLQIAAGAVDSLQVKYTPWKPGRDDSIILFRRNKNDGHTLQIPVYINVSN